MFKKFFPIFKNNPGLIYLDNAASAQKPSCVLKTMQQFYAHDYANVHRGNCPLASKATARYERAREIVASFLNAAPEEIIFTRGASESLNMAADGLSYLIKEGDEILTTVSEHHANFVPWQQLCLRKKAVLKVVSVLPNGQIDSDDFKKKLSLRTKIAAFTHMSNVLGVINPVRELVQAAHACGALSIVDGAQSIAHTPINLKDIDCDFFAFSGHKLYGPTGIGVLYGKKKALEKLIPTRFGGEMVREVFEEKTSFADIPARFEAGTPPFAEAIGLSEAVSFLEKTGMNIIEQHEKNLTQLLLTELSRFPDIQFLAEGTLKQGLISFILPGIHPEDISCLLAQQNICVRVGHHCAMPIHAFCHMPASLRISFGMYNTAKDVDTFIRAFSKALSFFKPKGTPHVGK